MDLYVFIFLIHKTLHSWLTNDDIKFAPWFVKISPGIPTLLKFSIMALSTVSLSIDLRVTASGCFVP